MRVLGVDPGLTRCGVGVVDVTSSRRVSLVAGDVIKTPSSDELGRRLVALEARLEELMNDYVPDSVAIEQVFSQSNVRTVAGTAQAAGIAALVATRRRIPVTFHTPTEVKAAVSGSGKADKAQVAAMVSRILGANVKGPADLTDAIALAICHSWRAPHPGIAAAIAAQTAGSAR